MLADVLWLAGAGIFAYFFPWTFLGVQVVCGIATVVLLWVERRLMQPASA
jgi:hypothetical protein